MVKNLAVRVHSFDEDEVKNGFKNIKVEDVGVSEPDSDEVLVKLTLRPILPSDLSVATGLYASLKDKLPMVCGDEGVGVIETLGDKVSGFSKGQRVVGTGFGTGTWAQYITVPAAKLKAVPDSVKDEAASQYFVNPITILGLMDTAAVPKGQYLLQAAAASSLGQMVIQYSKKLGIKTINVVRRQEQIQELKDLGADEVIDSSTEDIAERVKEITEGKGAYAALDPLGGDFTNKLVSSVRSGGVVLVYSALAGSEMKIPVMNILSACKYVGGFMMPVWLDTKSDAQKAAVFDEAMSLFADGTFTPHAGEVFPLENVHEAITASQKNAHGSKVFLK